jgi:hypothetical protein
MDPNNDGGDDVGSYIYQSALRNGIDPRVALRVAASEGLNAFSPNRPDRGGDGGSSFGPFQLHYAGINPDMPNPGLGDDFTKSTGLSAQDPSTWKQQVDFALQHASKNGWGAWMGAAKSGVSNYAGIGAAPATPPGRIDPSTMSDGSDPLAAATAALKGGAIATAAAGVAPKPLPPLPVPGRIDPSAMNDPADPLAAATKTLGGATAAQVATSAPVPPGVLGGAIPIDPKNYIPAGAQINLPSNVVDRTQPISQQLEAAGRSALDYAQQQIGGIPAAIAQDYQGATALNVLGNQQLNSGNAFPSFPSSDPRTWSAGGAINALGGMAGQVTAPLSGATRQLIEQPVTEATGNPDIGERAGFVANSLAMPAFGRMAEAAPSAAVSAGLGTIPSDDAALADVARNKYGINLTADQLGGNPGAKLFRSTSDSLPFSGAGSDIANTQAQFNAAVSRTIGENSAKLTPDVMNSANDRIGQAFDDIASRNSLKVDPQLENNLQNTMSEAGKNLDGSELKQLNNIFDNVFDKVDSSTGAMDGTAYRAIVSKGGALGRALSSNDSNVAHFAGQIKGALDDAFERSISPDDAGAYAAAKQQWGNLKTIEANVAQNGGNVSPSRLASDINNSKFSKNATAYGEGGDLGELATIGQKFMKPPQSSGTAERLASLGGLGAIGAGGNALLTGSLAGAAQGLGVVPAVLAANRFAVNPMLRSKWMANGLINRSLNPATTPFRPALGAFAGGAGLLNEPVNALGASNQ